jgi:cytochrome c2
VTNHLYGTEGEGGEAPPAATAEAPAKPEAPPAETKPAEAKPAEKAAAPAEKPAPAKEAAAAGGGDAAHGAQVFKDHLCFACHSFEPGKNGAGPSLAGVYGEKAGQVAGFNFSDALKNSGLTFDDATLDKWVQGPQKVVDGAKMMLAKPVTDAKDRADLIAYIKQESSKAK